MKKKIIIIVAAAFVAIIGLSVLFIDLYNDDRPLSVEKLPRSINLFVQNNFPGTTIRFAEIDFLDYSIWLDDNTHIEFDWNRTWDKVERYDLPVPQQLIPDGITHHVSNHFAGSFITEISLDDNHYEVTLSDRKPELLFSKDGRLIGIDD